MITFYESFYEEFRTELVRFASQYGRGGDIGEDLFEACHLSLCQSYCDISKAEYQKLMKTAIKNRYRDERRKAKNDKNTRLLIPTDLSTEEQVFRREEMRMIMHSLQGLSASEKSALLDEPLYQNKFQRMRKSRALRHFALMTEATDMLGKQKVLFNDSESKRRLH